MASQLISEIKLGGLLEVLRLLQKQGMNEYDFTNLRKDYFLIREVFRTVRDKFIFQNKEYAEGYEKTEQIEKFKKWNNELNLGITEDKFDLIPDFPTPPQSNLNQLFCTCLVYEFKDPLTTLLNGIKILNYALKEKGGGLEVAFAPYHGGKYKHEIPDELNEKRIRFRPEASRRRKGFRWIIVELGRELPLIAQLEKLEKEIEYFISFPPSYMMEKMLEKRDEQGLMNIGQELPYIAAMHLGWTLSIVGGKSNYLYPAPLALDIQLSQIYGDFSKQSHVLAIREDVINSASPVFGKNVKSFRISMDDFNPSTPIDYFMNEGYGICQIIKEVFPL